MNIPCLTDDMNSARADIMEAKVMTRRLIDGLPEGDPRRGVLLYVLKSLNDSEVSLVAAKRALEGCE